MNRLSLAAVVLISITLIGFRFAWRVQPDGAPLNAMSWDAFGYYMYLPSTFIYNDVKTLAWVPAVDEKYHVTGGELYQATKQKSGTYVFKYLGGVSLFQMPFFFIGHGTAKILGYPMDGFSPPYQYAIVFGAVFWVIFSFVLLRKILLRFFSDRVTALTLVLTALSTNLLQYVSNDGAMSHAWIFPLYVLIIEVTIRWHEKQQVRMAFFIGLIIGLATISRPTELVMLFIPLFWNTHTKEAAKAKWALVRQHRKQLTVLALGGLLGVLPQLLYWKYTSGSFIYDVGSKWEFLSPHFRVLFGWEKGWFIYTPVTILMILGFFFMRNHSFRKSVIIFGLLNIWIITAWHDWRYGASFSCRALMQSYPVYALSLAAFIQAMQVTTLRRVITYLATLYLISLNIVQHLQYRSGVIHYNDMNRKYYAQVYFNLHPTAAQFSLLDSPDLLTNESAYSKNVVLHTATLDSVYATATQPYVLWRGQTESNTEWMRIKLDLLPERGHRTCNLRWRVWSGDTVYKTNYTRIFYPTSNDQDWTTHVLDIEVPPLARGQNAELTLESFEEYLGEGRNITCTLFSER